jgi:hypothetical protein
MLPTILMTLTKIFTNMQVVQRCRRIKKKPPPKLPAPPRKKSASDDSNQLTLPSYIPPSAGKKTDAVSCSDKAAPVQLYSSLQLVVEADGARCVIRDDFDNRG